MTTECVFLRRRTENKFYIVLKNAIPNFRIKKCIKNWSPADWREIDDIVKKLRLKKSCSVGCMTYEIVYLIRLIRKIVRN